MTKRLLNRIKEKYYVEPSEYRITNFNAHDIYSSLTAYLDEFFRDSLPVINDGLFQGYIRICPTGLAHLIRIIFCQAVENSEIQAHIYISENEFSIYIKNCTNQKELERIEYIASKTGLSILHINDTFVKLYAEIVTSQICKIYARDSKLFTMYLEEAFFL